MKQFQVFYCAGPENLEICLNNLQQERGDYTRIQIMSHAGSDPRYTVIASWVQKNQEGDS